jgi:hypothetical protein
MCGLGTAKRSLAGNATPILNKILGILGLAEQAVPPAKLTAIGFNYITSMGIIEQANYCD